jgi:hypothetical protein
MTTVAVKPRVTAFARDRNFPASVLGPVEWLAFSRLIAERSAGVSDMMFCLDSVDSTEFVKMVAA